jgi:hypothetical protein
MRAIDLSVAVLFCSLASRSKTPERFTFNFSVISNMETFSTSHTARSNPLVGFFSLAAHR